MSEVLVRRAEREDAFDILAMMKELARHDHMEAYVTTTEERIQETCLGESPACYLLVAEVDGMVVGYASYAFNWENWNGSYYLALNELYVREGARGQGVGRQLMQAVARAALERDVWARWEVVPSNRSALAFYRKLGAYPSNWSICWWSQDAMEEMAGRD